MIAAYVELPSLLLLIGVMGFNLSQRQHLKHGEQKRLASLYTAIIFLFLHVGLLLISRFFSPPLADWMLIPLALLVGFLFWLGRRRIFLFRRSCAHCGAKLPIQTTLYYDDNLCSPCRDKNRPEVKDIGGPLDKDDSEAENREDDESSDPLINPPKHNLLENVPRDVHDFDWEAWRPTETAVLCYVFKDGQVLLIHKKRGLGRGKINAPGGRIEDGETPVQTAVRELEEEVGITPLSPFEVAHLSFVFTNGYSLKGHVFFARDFEGSVIETDEAVPIWTPVGDIPYGRMWEDDRLWLPRTIEGAFIEARFIFDGDTMVSHHINEKPRS